jgi:hypothetical protein
MQFRKNKINKCKKIKRIRKWRKMKLANLIPIFTPRSPPMKRVSRQELRDGRDGGATCKWTLGTEEMAGGKGSRRAGHGDLLAALRKGKARLDWRRRRRGGLEPGCRCVAPFSISARAVPRWDVLRRRTNLSSTRRAFLREALLVRHLQGEALRSCCFVMAGRS